jgi:hypothetical protein
LADLASKKPGEGCVSISGRCERHALASFNVHQLLHSGLGRVCAHSPSSLRTQRAGRKRGRGTWHQ